MSMTSDVAAVAEAWSARNQRWLSQRVAFWRERLERQEGATTDAPPQSIAHILYCA